MLRSLGKVTVTVSGTPIRLTNAEGDPTVRYPAHSFLVEALSTNTGALYVGTRTMDKTSLAGVFAIIPPPLTNSFPSFSTTVTYAPAAFNLADIWLDAAVSGEGALVSCVQA